MTHQRPASSDASLATAPRLELPTEPTTARVLVIGDGGVPTGFGRLVHSVVDRLPAHYDIHQLGINYRGEPHAVRWPLYPAALHGDVYGVDRVAELIDRLRPDLVFAVCDLWILGRYAEVLERYRRRVKTVVYFPVEGTPVDPEAAYRLRSIDRLVAYNQFGADAITEAFSEARRYDPSLGARPLDIVPHGVDTDTFHALPGVLDGDRSAVRRRLLPGRPDLDDAFLVLNANRNQPRKRIDLTMEGFALFARDKPANVKLYLHMGVEDCGWNLVTMARRLGIENRLLLTTQDPAGPNETSERLNLIYNACDVGINTSTGEGWGLVSFEHAAAGAAQVVPRHSACAELWDGVGETMEPSYRLTIERVLTEGWFVTPETVAGALETLYADRDRRLALARRGHDFVHRPEFSWDDIARRWDEIFQEVLRGHPLGH
ncbi:MAG: glycosyltransferase [Acidobacteriota bacterium]